MNYLEELELEAALKERESDAGYAEIDDLYIEEMLALEAAAESFHATADRILANGLALS